MRQLRAFEVPARERLSLEPSGAHLMLIDVVQPLKKGDRFPMKLRFERAGEVVSRDELSIGVDGRNLTIEAPLRLGEANSLVSVYAEVRANQFRRSFELSSDLDTGKIDAGLRDGVLTLRIPKLEQAKPRRVEVRVE